MIFELRHGSRCSCKVLEAAVGAKPGTISCAYCRSVLQKRWRMTCNHGESLAEEKPAGLERWVGIGELRADAIKAILVAEA